MADLLTSNLRIELEKTNAAISRWSDSKRSWLQTSKANYKRQEEECVITISSLKDHDTQLGQFKKLNDNIRAKQADEIDRYRQQIDKLESQAIFLESQLDKFTKEEAAEYEKMNALREESAETQKRADKSVNDLTKGVQLYLNLGLEFQKAPNDCMKFIFTQIDPKNPSRQYYFSIFVDEEDKYQFVESYPSIESTTTKKLIEQLNKDTDISRFVVSMRKAFCKLVR
jgi:hypothetical protein